MSNKRSKRYRAAYEKVDAKKSYALAEAVSVLKSLPPTKFDQTNWTAANVPPTTRRAGQTAIVSRQPVIDFTSQNGMISDRNGRIRPEVALRAWTSSSVTLLKVRMGCHGASPVVCVMRPEIAAAALR